MWEIYHLGLWPISALYILCKRIAWNTVMLDMCFGIWASSGITEQERESFVSNTITINHLDTAASNHYEKSLKWCSFSIFFEHFCSLFVKTLIWG